MTTKLEPRQAAEWIAGLASRFPTQRSVERLYGLLEKVAAAHTYDPGESDLDDEQSCTARIDLGDVRMARGLVDSH